jgi:uncharacterized membrane protein YqiK
MGRLMTLMAVLGVLAAPAALADKPAANPDQNAAQQCRAQLKGIGAKDFRSLWGNFGQCVALTAQQNQENVESAEEQCRAARAKDAAAFKDKYHSFGRCVSQTAKAMAQAQQQKALNAAQACKAERAKDAAQFRTTYGKGKHNAFANCVAAKKKSG